LATLSLIPLLILPIWNTIRTVRNRWRTLKVNKVRFVVSAAAALLVIVAIALAPLPHWVDVPCVIQARNARPIYVNDAGSLHELFAIDQQRVKSGDRLAVMKQQEVDLRVEQLTAEVSNLKKEVQQANRLDSQARSMARSKLAAAERTLEEYKRSLERMTLKVPAGVEGAVLSPPRREEIGRQYRVGEMFCQIGDPKDLEAFLVVPHSDLSLVRSGQSVSLKFDGHVGSIVRSSIESISADAIKELPPMLSNRHGGEVPTKPVDPNSQGVRRDQQTPIAASYGVVALLPNETGTWRPGLRGYARVHLPPMCIYERAMRSFFQTWNFKL
jgi:putative peptide zinc metalloprotease protein